MTTQRNTTAILAVVALAAVTLAGCTALGGNRAPDAKLEADKTKAMAGDTLVFDARASSDPDGNVTSWVFDFGDGNRTTVSPPQEPQVRHAYTTGGDYKVGLTVLDDGTGDSKKSDTTELAVRIDQAVPVRGQVAKAAVPVPLNASSAYDQTWRVNDGARSARLNLSLQGLLPAGTSQVRVELRGPDHGVLQSEAFDVQGATNRTVRMDVPLKQAGQHELTIDAVSGSVSFTGDLTTLYG
jgi:PKD repeat protein